MQDNNVIITNQTKLDSLKKSIAVGGLEKLLVVSDFDKTLTSCFVAGKKITSLISILRDEHYLTPDYSEKAQALYDFYHPLELDQNISIEVKQELMHEWWSKHYDLLIESGLNKQDLKQVAESDKISLRPGANDFFDFLNSHKIPLVILSSAGVGSETIGWYLDKFDKQTENIHIVSNEFIWGETGKMLGVREPIIHTFNKDFTVVKILPIFKDVESRKNVILIGDGLGDAQMLNGFEYDNVIKIGFLNENSQGELAEFKENYDIIILNDGSLDYVLDSFKQVFDVVILNDGPMDYINSLLKELAYER